MFEIKWHFAQIQILFALNVEKVKRVCIKNKVILWWLFLLKVDIQCVGETKLSFVPCISIFCTKTIQLSSHATLFWVGGWEGEKGLSVMFSVDIYFFFPFILYFLFFLSNCSASLCQSCSSGSCSSRSWCVSQEAGGVRLWRWCPTWPGSSHWWPSGRRNE